VARPVGPSAWLPLKALPQVLRQASSEWIDDNAQRLGASLAFYTLLSLAPLVVIAVGVAAVIYGQQAAEGRLAWEIQGLAGPDIARTIQGLIKDAYKPRTGVMATLAGLATLVFAASSVFVELHDAMNTIWNIPPPVDRTTAATLIRLIKDRFYSFVLVVGTGFLLLTSLVLSACLAAMKISVPRAATIVLSALIIMALFAALYKIVPDVRLRWSDVALGAAITSLFFTIGKQLLGLYFAHTSFESTYGAAGSPIVVLVWVYYSAQIFFWGAEFSKVYKRTLGSRQGG
jgi:membrane protein